MISNIHNVALDCTDPYTVATFWSEVTGQPLADDDFPGDPVATIKLPIGVTLYFERVPEPKTVKNRLHLCLRPTGRRDDEIDRLVGRGARLVHDRREPDGTGWVVLADPEGNEFCVLGGDEDG